MLIGLTPAQRIVLILAVAMILAAAVVTGAARLHSPAPRDDPVGYQPPTPADTTIQVDVAGQVYRPGLYKLPAGSRVMDAVRVAGGMTSRARPESVNLADWVEDGERVFVAEVQAPPPAPPPSAVDTGAAPDPSEDEPAAAPPTVPAAQTPRSAPPAASPRATPPAPAPAAVSPPLPIAINRASLEELEQLPGVGEKLAREILYFRALNGPFHSFEELKQIPGIGDATIAKIRTCATLN